MSPSPPAPLPEPTVPPGACSGQAIGEDELPPHLPALRAYLAPFSRGAEDLEELVQETMVVAVRRFPTFRGNAKLLTWLCAIGRKRVLERLRRRREAPPEVAAEEASVVRPGTESDPFRAVERAETAAHLDAALKRLSRRERELVVGRHLEGLGVADHATRTGRTHEATKSALRLARKHLRHAFEAVGGRDPSGP